ncbi:MAG: Carotenoid biosynthesis protein, partial [uncultured Gemmatimonadaceae bacterium]
VCHRSPPSPRRARVAHGDPRRDRLPRRARRAVAVLGVRVLDLPHRHPAGVAPDADQPGRDARGLGVRAGDHGGARRARRAAARGREDRRPAGAPGVRRGVHDLVRRGAPRHEHRLPVRRLLVHPAARLPRARARAVQHPDVVVLHAVLLPRDLRPPARRARRRAHPVEVGGGGRVRAHRVGRVDGPGDGEDDALALAPAGPRDAVARGAARSRRHLLRDAAQQLARLAAHRDDRRARDARARAAQRDRRARVAEQLPPGPLRGERRAAGGDLRPQRHVVGGAVRHARDGGARRAGGGEGAAPSAERRAGRPPVERPRRRGRRL